MIFSMLIVLYFYISTFWNVCVCVCVFVCVQCTIWVFSPFPSFRASPVRCLCIFWTILWWLHLYYYYWYCLLLLLLLLLALLAIIMQRHNVRSEMKLHSISWCSRLGVSPYACSSVLAFSSAVLRVRLLLCTHKTGLYWDYFLWQYKLSCRESQLYNFR